MSTVFYQTSLLPSANEVWDKVMFLHLSVIFVHRGCVSQHAMDPPGQTPPLARTHTHTHTHTHTPLGRQPLETATEEGSTHPTGMHSCFTILSIAMDKHRR